MGKSYKDSLKSIVNLILLSGFDSDMEYDTLDEEMEHNEPTELEFSTREHGDVGAEEVGQGDLKKAKNLMDALTKNDDFIDLDLTVEPECVDEWVLLTIKGISPENYE